MCGFWDSLNCKSPDNCLGRLKWKLQWTGWLQYIPNLIFALLFIIITLVLFVAFNDVSSFVWLPTFIIGFILSVILLYDIATVKFGIHFAEKNKYINISDNLDLFDIMLLRRSCRSFQKCKLDDSDLNKLLKYVTEESSKETYFIDNKQSIRFEYICNKNIRVWPVVGAQEFLIAIASKEYNRLSIINVGRCLQKIVIFATSMGLATCWIGPGADHSSVISLLKNENKFSDDLDHIICFCAIGYKSKYMPMMSRLMIMKQHTRLSLPQLFFNEKCEHLEIDKEPFKQFGRCYEACRWSPSSFNSQTTRCIGVKLKRNDNNNNNNNDNDNSNNDNSNNSIDEYFARFDFCASTKSRYYAPVQLGIWLGNWELGCEQLGIKGHFVKLTNDQRNISNENEHNLNYDMSWIQD